MSRKNINWYVNYLANKFIFSYINIFFKYSIDGTHHLLIQFSWCCNAHANCNDVGHTGSLSKVWRMWYSEMDSAKVSQISIILNRSLFQIKFPDKWSSTQSRKSILINDKKDGNAMTTIRIHDGAELCDMRFMFSGFLNRDSLHLWLKATTMYGVTRTSV